MSDSRILDFDDGTCNYHRFPRDLGNHDVHWLEIEPYLAHSARGRVTFATVVTRFADLPDEPFDQIYANRVPARIYNPLELIDGPISDRLATRGHLVLTLPNFKLEAAQCSATDKTAIRQRSTSGSAPRIGFTAKWSDRSAT